MFLNLNLKSIQVSLSNFTSQDAFYSFIFQLSEMRIVYVYDKNKFELTIDCEDKMFLDETMKLGLESLLEKYPIEISFISMRKHRGEI